MENESVRFKRESEGMLPVPGAKVFDSKQEERDSIRTRNLSVANLEKQDKTSKALPLMFNVLNELS
jgi:hypothetical protein